MWVQRLLVVLSVVKVVIEVNRSYVLDVTSYDTLMNKEIRQVTSQDSEYFPRLRGVTGAPSSLWVRGAGIDASALHVAGIGSRRVHAEALVAVEKFFTDLIAVWSECHTQPLVLISGLALGVDAQVHRIALEHDVPTTGVLFTPINRMYPPENLGIARQILEQNTLGNAIVSEHAPVGDDVVVEKDSEAPKQRNRITVWSSDMVIVSGVYNTQSGTRNAVRQAHEQGRPVFLLPKTITPPVRSVFVGQYGARVVTSAREMLDLVQSSNDRP